MSGGDLPAGWEQVDFDVLVSGAQNGLSKRQGDEGTAVPVLRLADFDGRRIAPKEPRKILMSDRERSDLSLKQGDLLCVRVNGSENIVGRVSVFRQTDEWSFCDHFIRYRLNPGVLPDYVERFFETIPARRHIESSFVSSAGQKTVNRGIIGSIQVPLAPLPEQRRIVEKIEALTARSRRAREALDALPTLIDRYRQSILAAAFRGDLTADWRAKNPDAETASAFLARAGLSASSVDASDIPLEIPSAWQWAYLSDIADVKGGLAKGKKRTGSAALEAVPYLRVANVQRGFLDLGEMKEIDATADEIAQLLLCPGDILFNEGGDRDKLGRGWVWSRELDRCIHQNHVFRARLRSSEINPFLISHFGNTFGQRYFFGEGKQSVNLASISLSKLRALPIPIIPPREQAVLIARVCEALARVEAFQALHRVTSDRLPRLDQSILAKAFRGELVPQDPTDEPASVLLDRIRAERAAAGPPLRRGRKAKT